MGLTEGDAQKPWAEWSKARGNLKASPQVDIWAFGALAFKMAVKDGASIFHSTEADNIVKREDLETLAYGWEQRKLAEMKRVVWDEAADLVLKCLQTAPGRRPKSFTEILRHPFLAEGTGQAAEPYFPESLEVRGAGLHTAIDNGREGRVSALLETCLLYTSDAADE